MISRIKHWIQNLLQRLTPDTTQGGIFLDRKQINQTIAVAIVVGIFLFLGGYFWGQHTAIDQVLNAVERDSFADQIYYSMCPANEAKEENTDTADTADEETEEQAPSEAQPQETPQPQVAESKKFFGELAGFGTHQNAQRCAHRLEQKGFKVQVVKRISKSARGRTVAWYQVTTEDFADKAIAEQTIARMKALERLGDVKILER